MTSWKVFGVATRQPWIQGGNLGQQNVRKLSSIGIVGVLASRRSAGRSGTFS